MMTESWREHFSVNAGDLIQIHRMIGGDTVAKQIIMECFKRRPSSAKISETTVENVLQALNFWIESDGSVVAHYQR